MNWLSDIFTMMAARHCLDSACMRGGSLNLFSMMCFKDCAQIHPTYGRSFKAKAFVLIFHGSLTKVWALLRQKWTYQDAGTLPIESITNKFLVSFWSCLKFPRHKSNPFSVFDSLSFRWRFATLFSHIPHHHQSKLWWRWFRAQSRKKSGKFSWESVESWKFVSRPFSLALCCVVSSTKRKRHAEHRIAVIKENCGHKGISVKIKIKGSEIDFWMGEKC